MKTLAEIQQTLKAPKGQVNAFGKYKYRSCEDILEAVKPLLGEWSLIITDMIVEVGGRVYVAATAEISKTCLILEEGKPDTERVFSHKATGFAREAENKKGMDDAQITGSASSYARKYALNGLFAIDDTKDPDSTNNHNDKKADPLTVIFAKCQKAKSVDGDGWEEFKIAKGIPNGPTDVRALTPAGLKQLEKDLDKFLK